MAKKKAQEKAVPDVPPFESESTPYDSSRPGLVEVYWRLARHPFRLSPDPDFIFESTSYREALARVLYNVTQYGGGVTVVTGSPGSGKTTLTRGLLAMLPRDLYRVALVVNPDLSVTQLLATILEQFGEAAHSMRKKDLHDRFEAFVVRQIRAGVVPVLVIDEAQTLKRHHLEHLRLLLNFEANDRKLFHLVLLGTSDLGRKIERIPQLAGRVTMRCLIGGLRGGEVRQYLEWRLHVAGATGNVFRTDAVSLIAKLSAGVPRRVNTLAAGALSVGALSKAKSITPRMVNIAFEDLKHRDAK